MKERVVLAVALFLPLCVHAQKNEISIGVGAAVSPDANGQVTCGEAINCQLPPNGIGPLSLGPGTAIEASYSRRFLDLKAAGIYVELPFVRDSGRAGPNLTEISTLFFTPSLQFKFLPGQSISPFLSVGGGLAHIGTKFLGNSAPSDTTAAAQFGGGLDFRLPVPHVAFRAQVSDFVTGSFGQFTSKVQHIYAGGGVVFRF